MPESKKRKNAAQKGKDRPSATRAGQSGNDDPAARRERSDAPPPPSPRWWAPTMVTLMVIGLICVVLTYLMRGDAPVPGLGNWNLAIGFGVMLVGFFMTLRWR
ncbi:hypothetical protein GCM10023169_32160 [Georgenia halophila]|uniref:Cell division protein CrgA n=1 Tax=Georgenia halophila TaxID=620889 RepID=A0ABP8LH46_9MICO